MRVLLVCVPRTGSNSLIGALSKGLGISHISIPDSFNFDTNKALINSVINKNDIIFRMSPIHNVGYNLKEFSSFFDKIILLSRRNDEEHYKSIINLYYREHILKFGTNARYVYEDIPAYIIKQIEQKVNWEEIANQKRQINTLGLEIGENVLYYEDLFYSEYGINYLKSKFSNLDISKFNLQLSKTNKLSITREKSIL